MPKIRLAISIGDVNGVGLELALRTHREISALCEPIYCAHREVLESGARLLGLDMPQDMKCDIKCEGLDSETSEALELPQITPGAVSGVSGRYSFEGFMHGVRLCERGEASALVTLPIHKKAWELGGVSAIGHTDALSRHFGKQGIMMLGCEQMYVALLSDHISLSAVSAQVNTESVREFLLAFAQSVRLSEPCCVLGLNPHCGDSGLIGHEDSFISAGINEANALLKQELFFGPCPADSAFAPHNRARFRYFVSMYHDVGLAPLKALYFEESINISLNLPILRTSVDHGVAFDKAYKGEAISAQSYINAVKYAVFHAKI